MTYEIERKFLVSGDGWREAAGRGSLCRQGYLVSGKEGATVRVRLMGDRGYLTIKGPAEGLSRPELEYEIPPGDAEYLIGHLCTAGTVSKIRYAVPFGGRIWEVDEFLDANAGLVLAEIELNDAGEAVLLPEWLGAEVSTDSAYTNAALARQPFSRRDG